MGMVVASIYIERWEIIIVSNWAKQAIEISKRFNAYIIPLLRKDQPYSKLSLDKWKDSGLPASKLPSKDPAQIDEWAQKFTAYGVVPSTEFIIVDVDVKEGQNGKNSIKFLSKHGLPTRTFVVQSPSGGLHLYYNKPTHYNPSQSVGNKVKFEDDSVMQEWESMCLSFKGSPGIDTRYGWGYVVGPGSTFGDQAYKLLSDHDLATIPSTVFVGYSSGVSAENPKAASVKDEDISPGSIRENRNDHALNWTFRLSLRRYPDSVAKLMIRDAVKFYDNHDEEAPTFAIMWDMYERAKEKERDIVTELLARYVYIIKGRRVLNISTGEVVKLEEFLGAYSGKLVPIESANGVKMMNPVKIWESSPDRILVHDEMFDIGLKHGVVEVPMQNGTSLYYNKFVPPSNLDLGDVEPTGMGLEIGTACIQVINNILSSPYDREWFRKWVGQMLFDPGTRPAWHWHIFSNARGIGKDTLASIISKLYGESNVARFGTEAFEDKSNLEFFSCGLGIMSDFAPISGQGGKSRVLAQFKALTGANVGRMRAMYMDGQQRGVSLRFLMLSNAYNDFPVDNEDRRLFKCESKGVKLHERVYALAHCFTSPDRVTKEMVEQFGLNFTDTDLYYAHALLIDYFQTSGYEEMSGQFDCPQNDIKEENRATTEPKYYQDIRRAIQHYIYVFASDIVTRDSLALFLDHLKVTTSPDTVLRDMLDKGMLQKMPVRTTNGSTRSVQILLGYLEYDNDLLRIQEIGTKTPQNTYSCRNHDHWSNMDAKRQTKRELLKIINYPNIKKGWNEKTASLMKNNVVPISDGT